MLELKISKEKTKNIFILEDNENRIIWFKKKFDYVPNLVITDNVKEAKNILKKEKFDLIFLDHDLDDKVFVNSNDENTGYQVAKMLRNTINKDTFCIVHSMNPIGAGKMVKAHPFDTIHIPFHLFAESITFI